MLAQLTYTSADYVDEKGAQSGWHIRQRSEGLDEQLENEIFRQIRPTFQPLVTLPVYASPEDIRSAEMRLSQSVTQTGAVLVNTVQAGNDTTGRPNTFSHACHIPTDRHGDFLGISAWRSDHWLTPLGAQAVSQAVFAESSDLLLNSEMDFDGFVLWVEEAEKASFLVKLVEALARTWVVDENLASRHLVAVAVESCDEAAECLNALSHVMAPGRAWKLSWSLWERITHISSFEALEQAKYDLVFIPQSDLGVITKLPENVTLLDMRDPEPGELTTSWARFVKAVLRDQDTIDDVFDDLRELGFGAGDTAHPEWMLALAEAQNPGVLSCVDSDLEGQATAVLLSTEKSVLDAAPEVATIISQHLAEKKDKPFEYWQNVLLHLNVETALTPVLAQVVQSYLQLGCVNPVHVASGIVLPEVSRQLVDQWMMTDAAHEVLPQLFISMGDSLQTDALNEYDLRALLWLNREGCAAWDHPALDDAIGSVVHGLVDGSITDPALLSSLQLLPALQMRIQEGVEHVLQGRIYEESVGFLLPELSRRALEPIHRDDLICLSANSLVAQWSGGLLAHGSASAAAVVSALLKLGGQWSLRQEIDQSLAPFVSGELVAGASSQFINNAPQTIGQALIGAFAGEVPCDPLSQLVCQMSFPDGKYAGYNGEYLTPRFGGAYGGVTAQPSPYRYMIVAQHLENYRQLFQNLPDCVFLGEQDISVLFPEVTTLLARWELDRTLGNVNLKEASTFIARRAALALLMLRREGRKVNGIIDSIWLREALQWCTTTSPREVLDYCYRHYARANSWPYAGDVGNHFITMLSDSNEFALRSGKVSAFDSLKRGLGRDTTISLDTIMEVIDGYANDLRDLLGEIWVTILPSFDDVGRREMLARLSKESTNQLVPYLRKLMTPESGSRLGFFGFGKGE